MTADQGADERRIAHQLRRLGVGPDAAPTETDRDWWDDLYDEQTDPAPEQADEPEEKPKAIVPTRVIPAGAPLPDRPPEPDDIPPWRPQPAAAPPAPPAVPPVGAPWHGPSASPPPYGPIEVRVTFAPMALPPEPTRRERLWAWLRTYATPLQAITGLVLAVAPILPRGYSCAGTWYYAVGQAREFGTGWGYAIGGGALLLAGYALVRKRDQRRDGAGSGFLRVFFLATTFVGAFGAIDPYDPVTWITGVHPR